MRLFRRLKINNIFSLLARYIAEVVIIFLGITISFIVEEWREENKQKQELIELTKSLIIDAEAIKMKLVDESTGSELWLRNLDSIRIQRESTKISEDKLQWFYRMITNQTFAIFDPNSPAYLSATNSGLIDKLPDSVQSKIYNVYQVRLRNFQFLYDLQIESITHFRNYTMIPTGKYLYLRQTPSVEIDIERFAEEIRHPAYGNFINQIIATEKIVFRLNSSSTKSITELIETLNKYRAALET